MSVHKTDRGGGCGGGYDGVVMPGSTICIASYIGVIGGPDRIKPEEQIPIPEDGPESLSQTPFEDDWL